MNWHHLISAVERIALFIVPSLCAYCRAFLKQRDILCSDCLWKIFPLVSKQIDITTKFSVTVFAITDYKDPLKKLILSKKWSDSVPSYHLGTLMCDILPITSLDCDVVVPVPLHWMRYASRGFNQAENSAKVIAQKKNIPLAHLLKRIKKTAFQFELASSMRDKNVKNAFVLAKNYNDEYKDKHIMLVDDLMTTGATIREAARALLQLKPRKITVIVACRVL
jgi:ComF family protein